MIDRNDSGTARFAAILAGASVLILLLASLAFVLLQLRAPADRFAACREVQIAGGQSIGGPFELIDHFGNPATDQTVIDRPSLIYFGYTFCPDVCPLDVVRNVEAVDLLKELGHEVRPVFITVDPERDTVNALSDYAGAMHEDMIALTGEPSKLKQALARFGGSASKQDDSEFYLMQHTTLTYLTLPREGTVAIFTRRLPPEDLAKKTQCYLNS